MSESVLFADLADQVGPGVIARRENLGAARVRAPERDQIRMEVIDIDSLIGADHPARIIWAYVETLDLGVLEERIRAREHGVGQAPPSPHLLVALWLFAMSQGVGSARALDRLCKCHDAYRWLCGGVSLNYHTLSDFRIGCADLLDRLLIEHAAALAASGVIDLDEVMQDGLRVRAAAGTASFRRAATLDKHLKQAEALVEALKREVDDDPDASNRRIRAAQQRAAADRVARVKAAQAKMIEVEAQRQRLAKTNAKQTAKQGAPRVSTTDPQARVMKMPDGGWRPAYNLQIASTAEQIILGVDVDTSGSDRGRLRPMLEQIRRRYKPTPKRYLADGGFTRNDDIEWAAAPHNGGVKVFCPPIKNRHKSDPFAPRPKDGPGMLAWRRRMRSPTGKAIYKHRSPCEVINARGRRCGLVQLTVRGCTKAKAVFLWFALSHNILRAHALRAAT